MQKAQRQPAVQMCTDVVNGGFDSLNRCSVFQIKQIKEDGLAFACFSIFKCLLYVGNSTVVLP